MQFVTEPFRLSRRILGRKVRQAYGKNEAAGKLWIACKRLQYALSLLLCEPGWMEHQ